MKILVLNAGSSSIKFQLFQAKSWDVVCIGLIEQIAQERGHITLKYNGKDIEKALTVKDHAEGIRILQELLLELGILKDFNELTGVGHRVVHGGEYFSEPTLINKDVIDKIKEISPLAPLHNPVNLIGIEAIAKKYKNIKQVAVFDTAFHQSLPKSAYIYALPYKFYEDQQVRRYGFHGTSHHYVAKKAAKYLGIDEEKVNLITLHLGNGASATAIKSGKSIDTSMGLTPLEGLVMGTRSGDIDPAIILYLSECLDLNIDEIDNMLNKKSGLKGICGLNDMREIEKKVAKKDFYANLALEIFCYRIKKYIGAYTVSIGKVDAIVFTGGIGEHSVLVREKVCKDLDESIGAKIDLKKNTKNSVFISTDDSKIKILVVPTDEELEIAKQTYKIVS